MLLLARAVSSGLDRAERKPSYPSDSPALREPAKCLVSAKRGCRLTQIPLTCRAAAKWRRAAGYSELMRVKAALHLVGPCLRRSAVARNSTAMAKKLVSRRSSVEGPPAAESGRPLGRRVLPLRLDRGAFLLLIMLLSLWLWVAFWMVVGSLASAMVEHPVPRLSARRCRGSDTAFDRVPDGYFITSSLDRPGIATKSAGSHG